MKTRNLKEYLEWDKKNLADLAWTYERYIAALECMLYIRDGESYPIKPVVPGYDFSKN